MIEKALSAGEDYKAADYIEQAAKEMGGVYTGRAASAIHSGGGPAGGREQAAAFTDFAGRSLSCSFRPSSVGLGQ